MSGHKKYMKRCLELAAKGLGSVAPNPMVGCVIVHNNKVIGEGYHEQYGGAHAEVNAINSVKDKSLLRNSILYVNLEPCSHFGKTPPCADLIIRYKVKYVVIGSVDPNPIVTGKGIHRLVAAGCDVKVGILEQECNDLNRRFFAWHKMKRPFVILKWAQTKDGYMGITGSRFQVSGSKAQVLLHQWRTEEQSIMVGTNTALVDNPRLTARKVKGKNPLRLVIDRELKIPGTYHLLDKKVPTLVLTERKRKSVKNLDYTSIEFGPDVLAQVMSELHKRNIQSLIVEGGANLLALFITERLWDEARVITASSKLRKLRLKERGLKAPVLAGKIMGRFKAGPDTVEVFRNTSRSS
jgi:diaminohydroxyphosphoribosylaminopyrimidine deaminase / 5-amino-6-(5-phosphoribosylamino)uracil reductase